MIYELEYKTCYLDGRLGRARDILRKLIAEHPDCAAFHADLALVYLKQGKIAEAREEAEKAYNLVVSSRAGATPSAPTGQCEAGGEGGRDGDRNKDGDGDKDRNTDADADPLAPADLASPDVLAIVGFVREGIGDYGRALSLYRQAEAAISPAEPSSKRRLWVKYAIDRVSEKVSRGANQEKNEAFGEKARASDLAKLRITYFLDSSTRRDALSVIYEQVKRLASRGHTVYVLSRTDRPEELSGSPVEVIRVPVREELYERTPDSDVVIATSWRTAFDAARVHGAVPFYLVQPSPELESTMRADDTSLQASKNLEASFKLPLRLIASSDHLRYILKTLYNRTSSVVPYGVDLNAFNPAGRATLSRGGKVEAGEEAEEAGPGTTRGPEFGEGPDASTSAKRVYRVLVAGSDSEPWIETAYEALRNLMDRRPGEIELLRLSPSRRLDFSIHVAQWFEDPPEKDLPGVYSQADIFLSGSPEGPFSQAALQAMASGLPIIVCSSPSNPSDGHITDQEHALVVPQEDPQGMAGAIETLIDDGGLRARLAANARQIVQEYNWDAVIEQLEGLLQEAVMDVQMAYPSPLALGVEVAHPGGGIPAHLNRKPRPTLSLCMIVKNEERFLARCLESVKDVVDEMIIVDTGSTDRTVEIAKSYGAKVYFHEWKNDFAEARNASLEKATGDWILVMDADEVLVPSSVEELYTLASTELKAVYCARIINETGWDEDQGTGYGFEHYMARFFPNDPVIRYRGAVHERIIPENGMNTPILAARNIMIRHAGYRNDIALGRTKHLRNLALLERTVEAYPEHPFYRYSLGATYYEMGRLKSALEQLDMGYKAAMAWPEESFGKGVAVGIMLLMSNISKGLGQSDSAEVYLQHALEIEPNNPDVLFALGELYRETGKLEDALALYRRALNPTSRQFVGITHDPATNTWKPRLGLCSTYCTMKEWDKAEAELAAGIRNFAEDRGFLTACRALWKSLEKCDDPGSDQIKSSLYEFLSHHEFTTKYLTEPLTDSLAARKDSTRQHGRDIPMPQGEEDSRESPLLSRETVPESTEDILAVAEKAYEMGDYGKAIALYGKAGSADNVDNPDFYLNYGRALKMAGYKKEALQILLKALKYNPGDFSLLQELIELTTELKDKVNE